jgi:hypothetical protein
MLFATLKYFRYTLKYKNNLYCWCKSCENKYRKKYRKTQKYIQYHRKYQKQYIKSKRGKQIIKNLRQSEKGKARKRKTMMRFRHSLKGKKYYRNYHQNRRKNDIRYRILCNLRSRLIGGIKGNFKQSTTIELLGCSIEKLKQHLESKFKPGMSWSNYGKWHIDHIKPCARFDLSKPNEQKKCFHYTNLQPLWAEENLKKNKYGK